MERLKSKSKLLIAFVLAAVLAMAGVGYALANPNDEESTGISTQAETSSNKDLKYKIVNKTFDNNMGRCVTNDESYIDGNILYIVCDTAFGNNFYPALTYWCIDFYGDTNEDATIDLTTLNMSDGDSVCIHAQMYETGGHTCYHDYTIEAYSDDTDNVPNQSQVAFDFNFKATGIQSTGFNDYHEAFAALNN